MAGLGVAPGRAAVRGPRPRAPAALEAGAHDPLADRAHGAAAWRRSPTSRRDRFNEGLARPVAVRVYNSIDQARFDPDRVRPAPIREELGISARTLAARSDRADHALEGPGHVDPDARRAARAGIRRPSAAGRRGRLRRQASPLRQPGLPASSLERSSTSSACAHAVHFLGQRNDVPEIMRALDLTLLPSWDEPFGLVTVESMALGTPPLVSAAGAGPELVEDGVTGMPVGAEAARAVGGRGGRAARRSARLGLMGRARRPARPPLPRRRPGGRDGGDVRARARQAAEPDAGAAGGRRHRPGRPEGGSAWPS